MGEDGRATDSEPWTGEGRAAGANEQRSPEPELPWQVRKRQSPDEPVNQDHSQSDSAVAISLAKLMQT